MHIYTTFLRSNPSNYVRISDTVSVSQLSMSLKDYISTAEEYVRATIQDDSLSSVVRY